MINEPQNAAIYFDGAPNRDDTGINYAISDLDRINDAIKELRNLN